MLRSLRYKYRYRIKTYIIAGIVLSPVPVWHRCMIVTEYRPVVYTLML